jgi:hypothetical protein
MRAQDKKVWYVVRHLFLCTFLGSQYGCQEAPDPDAEYAEACQAALECQLRCSGQECVACVEAHGDETLGLSATYDMMQCAHVDCSDACAVGTSIESCLECVGQQCPEPTAACNGNGGSQYDEGIGEPFEACYDIRVCIGECDDEACINECFWSGRPLARLAIYKLTGLIMGTCAERCAEAPSPRCEECIEEFAEERGIEECLEPAPPEGGSGGGSGDVCQFIEDPIDQCVCQTGDVLACIEYSEEYYDPYQDDDPYWEP